MFGNQRYYLVLGNTPHNVYVVEIEISLAVGKSVAYYSGVLVCFGNQRHHCESGNQQIICVMEKSAVSLDVC